VTTDEITWLLAACRHQGAHPAEESLLHGGIREVAEFRISTSSVYKLTFEDGREGAFKSIEGAGLNAGGYNHTAATSLLSDVAAWVVAKALAYEHLIGGVVLTVCAYPGVGFGSLQAWLPGEPSGEGWQTSPRAREAALLDALIAQQDRNGTNFNYDDSTDELGLFDNSFAFALPGHSRGTSVIVEHARATQVDLGDDLVQALERFQTSKELNVLREFLPPDRVARMEERASMMLANGELLPQGEF
jgi:hypothetical protein